MVHKELYETENDISFILKKKESFDYVASGRVFLKPT